MWDSSFIWNELEIKKLENKRAEKRRKLRRVVCVFFVLVIR